MEQNYYLGLDIGTNSVGWAVTDSSYHLCQFKHKDMWGIRLFDEAKTAQERRTARCARRRLERRKQRIDLLQELFAVEMNKVDDTFFIRLNESRLHLEDKIVPAKHPLFRDENYTDREYYQEYPTIFHLRKDLIEDKAPHDIRLVYLALHHIIKNRGHFLITGGFSDAKSFAITMQNLQEAVQNEFDFELYLDETGLADFERILQSRDDAKSVKAKKLLALFSFTHLEEQEKKRQKTIVDQVCKFVCGMTGDICKLFKSISEESSLEKTKFSFGDAQYEETIADQLESALPEKFYVLECMKALYDWSILADILAGEEYISFAKVKQYALHKENLKRLRIFMQKYCDKHTREQFFNAHQQEKGNTALCNYAAYIGSVKKNGKEYSVARCTEEDFYKGLEKILKAVIVNEKDAAEKEYLLQHTQLHILLPLQRSKDNGTVPKQIHELELNKILKQACQYLPFLNDTDGEGISVAKKIKDIFNFRIPYYVGPLSDRHRAQGANNWMIRREGRTERIYPWNFEQVVDMEQSNTAFITRMTNKCTYLVGEDVLPRHSLLYSTFMVLNAINPLKIKGYPATELQKQNIFRYVFLKHQKVTAKEIIEYLNQEDPGLKLTENDLSGFDENSKVSMSSYLDFQKKVFGERMAEDAVQMMVEDIIKWKTIYGDDKQMLKRIIQQHYPDQLTDAQLKVISGLRYSGWGNFSKAFLNGIQGIDTETGEAFTIIKALWNTNCNLMQLLSGRFTFQQQITQHNKAQIGEMTQISYENVVEPLAVSPAVKRSIWQTVQIVQEIKQIKGIAPQKIFIEMARDDDSKGKKKGRTTSRKQQLLDLYAACESDAREWSQEIEDKDEREFNSLKLYLYYLQKGRCMYTGERIDLDELMKKNSKWDKDHIYPQSKIKDDSLDNLVLVNKNVNAKKSNELLSAEIVQRQKHFWKELLEGGFLSKKKYDRLTRTNDFTEEELSGFISRQLVETRQSSKAVKDLLEQLYPDTAIVSVKAGLVSQFRKKDLCELKSRRLNDLHHAKDAYLNIVVGNVYYEKFTANPIRWMKENRGTNYSINRVFEYDMKKRDEWIWQAPPKNEKGKACRGEREELLGGTIDVVRETVRRNRMCYTEYTYCEKGELFAANPKHVESAKIPLKAGLDPEKYGGYYSPNNSYFALVEFDGKKKGTRIRNIIGVPVYIANMLPYQPDAFLHYCEEVKGLINVTVLYAKIKKNTLLLVDGFPLRIRGEEKVNLTFKQNLQLILKQDDAETVRKVEKYLEKNKDYAVDEKFDGLSDDSMMQLYDVLTEKLQTVYSRRPANKGKTLVEKREIFTKLDETTKAVILNEILTMLRCDVNTVAKLSKLGDVDNAGKITVNKNTVGASKLVLVNQSMTGLLENRTEL